MVGGANAERQREAEGAGGVGVGPGPPAPKKGRDRGGAQAAVTQWLGLRGTFPEPQTALLSLGATCPAETRSRYSQLLLTLLCTPAPQHIACSHSVP